VAWLFGKSKLNEQRRRAAQAYVQDASLEPDEADVQWLASILGDHDDDRARWELRYTRRGAALLVAEREALDDATGSLVAREMRQALQMDRSVAAGMVAVAERQLGQRLTSLRTAFTDRSPGDTPDLRVARAMLDRLGVRDVTANMPRVAAIVRNYYEAAQVSLRKSFGIASVPEDQPPSLWAARPSS
jgi:hypothetical protein